MTSHHEHGRRPPALVGKGIALVVVLAAVTALTVTGVVGLGTGGRQPAITTTRSAANATPGVAAGCRRAAVKHLADDVFDWDTTALRSAYVSRLAGDVDSSGSTLQDVLLELDGYLPSASEWLQLRAARTRQRLEVTSIRVPDSWNASADHEGQSASTKPAAYNVQGIRHRSGLAGTLPIDFAAPVAFTMFVDCPRTGSASLVGLSALGRTLP